VTPLALVASGEGALLPPNIVFILADDLGYADLSCYGRRDYQTPHIDRLAAEGVRFTQAYANSAVCSATRTALITGRYQYRLAVGLEEPLTASSRQRNVGLPREHPTLPSRLKRAGTIISGVFAEARSITSRTSPDRQTPRPMISGMATCPFIRPDI